MGQLALPLILLGGSAIVGAINTKRTADKQNAILAESIRKSAEDQRRATAKSQQTMKKFEESGPEPYERDLEATYRSALQRKQQKTFQNLMGPRGEVSPAMAALALDSVSSANEYGGTLKDYFAAIDAAREQRRDEKIDMGDLSSFIEMINRHSAARDNITRMRLDSVQRDPWLDILSSVMSGGAMGMGRGTPTPTPTPTPKTFSGFSSP
jgi:uncharacterized protein YdbL (DUF1318 family)